MKQEPKRERKFLTAEWRHLAMVNYPIDEKILQPLVPKGAMLDTYKGVAYVSVVGFLFLHARVCGVPIPWHRNFEEVNLRFYVRRFAGDDWRRGVVFIKEIVPRTAIAAVARTFYQERYVSLPMRHGLRLSELGEAQSAEYTWQFKGQWNYLRAKVDGTACGQLPGAGSLEEFITEHYWGYVRLRNGSTVEYHVEHPRWTVKRATSVELSCDAGGLYGDVWEEPLRQPPMSAFIANGSGVTVFRGAVIRD